MIRDPLGLAAYGTLGRYADGGSTGDGGVDNGSGDGGAGGYGAAMGNGNNVGVADGATPGQAVGPGTYDSSGSPSFGLDPGTAASPGWGGTIAGSLARAGASALGAPGAVAQALGMGVNYGISGQAPSAAQYGGLAGATIGMLGGPAGSMIGGALGSALGAAGGYLGAHGDTMDHSHAAAEGAKGNTGQGSGLADYTASPHDYATVPAASQSMAQGLAGGGVARGHGGGSRLANGSGLVPGNTMGRADAIQMQVPDGSYVVPADVVSGVGQGNTQAGGKRITEMLGAQFKPSAAGPGFAHGGRVGMSHVRLSGGEYVVHPVHCQHLGGGDVKAGHAELDKMCANVRMAVADHAKNAPAPK